MHDLLKIDPAQEKEKIVSFLTQTFTEQKIDHGVIGLSGGIDSTTSFFLLKEVLPAQNIHVAHLYYFDPVFSEIEKEVRLTGIPAENIHLLSIRKAVDTVFKLMSGHSGKPEAHLEDLQTEAESLAAATKSDSGQVVIPHSGARMTKETELDIVRLGNIAARMRMIVLFDLAKRYNGLVVGTENKTENLLSYFTRYGDQASDIEPIEHLYKTQVLQLAKQLGVPDVLVNQKPTAGLWQGQTDEGQFGFTYEEADQVLFLHLEQNKSVEELEEQGFQNTQKILDWREKNLFKHQVPYVLKTFYAKEEVDDLQNIA